MINKMTITNAKYIKDKLTNKNSVVIAVIDGNHYSVPMNLDNTHYAEIKRQVDAGELTIEEAD